MLSSSPSGISIRRHWKYFQPHIRPLLFVFFALLLEMAFMSAVPVSIGYLIDYALIGHDAHVLSVVLLGLGIGAVVVAGFGLWRDYVFAGIGSNILKEIRIDMFAHLQRLSMSFYARQEVGQILARFSTDIAEVEKALELILTDAILPVLNVVFIILLLFHFDWRLALLAQLIWPLMLVGPRLFAPRVSAATRALKETEGDSMTVLEENVSTQTVVKAFGLNAGAMEEFKKLCVELAHRMVRARFFAAAVERSATTGIMLLQVLLLAVGAYLVARDIMTIGALVSFQALFVGLSAAMTEITKFLPTLLEAGTGAQRIEELLDETPQVVDRRDVAECPRMAQSFEFKNVSFGYAPEMRNLSHVSFLIPRGASVALVGASGSGKSTALKLLVRFYDPDEGSICIDGTDIRNIAQESLRAQMSFVFQDSFLFNVSIRENIRLGKLGASDEEVERAAKQAEIDEAIRNLPNGYDTNVGERGLKLSTGQRQRIAIARAIMRDPEILALDEATSALDPGSENAINRTFASIGRGRTVVSITHRLAMVTAYDKIIVLDNGVLAEQGTHEELLAHNGVYKNLWLKQSGFELSDDGEFAKVTIDRLRELPIFQTLDDNLLREVAENFVTMPLPAGRHVMHEGDVGDLLYIIVRGRVEVLKNGPDGVMRRVALLQDGDHFGEVALLQPVPRTATVRTLDPSVFLTLKRRHFTTLLERAPQLRTSLEEIFHQRIQDELRSVWEIKS